LPRRFRFASRRCTRLTSARAALRRRSVGVGDGRCLRRIQVGDSSDPFASFASRSDMVVLILFTVDFPAAASSRTRALPAPEDGLRILSSNVSSRPNHFPFLDLDRANSTVHTAFDRVRLIL
jgi:hypothetical protein